MKRNRKKIKIENENLKKKLPYQTKNKKNHIFVFFHKIKETISLLFKEYNINN